MKLTNWIKSWGVIGWAIFILALLSAYMIYVYFNTFHDGYSDDFNKWGAFGGYFGSITGLFAFLGVLYTVKQSNEQAKANEERGVFFKMLELYQKNVSNITDGKEIGNKAISNIVQEIEDLTVINIIYNEITSDSFKLSTNEDELFVQRSIATSLGCGNYSNVLLSNLNTTIRNAKILHKIYIPENYDRTKFTRYALRIVHKNLEPDFGTYSYKIIKEVAEVINNIYGYSLIQYFNSIFHLINFIENTSSENDYYKNIFINQLSSPELHLLLYNSVSSKSKPILNKYFLIHDIFENIDGKRIIFLSVFSEINSRMVKFFANDLIHKHYVE